MKKINQPKTLNSTWDKTGGRPFEFNNLGTTPKKNNKNDLRQPDQDEEIVEFIPQEKTMPEFIDEFGIK